MKRDAFLRSVLGVAAGLVSGRRLGADPAQETGSMPRRLLGATGAEVGILGLGGHHVGLSGSERRARELVEAALTAGITFFDTAESYQNGRSEEWLGRALEGRRSRAFLMTKTYAPGDRSAESAKRHLDGSLRRLRTDRLDLWQLHSIQSPEDVDRAFGTGGAMEFILEAKRQGIVRFVGVTGHVTPAAHLRALTYWDRGVRYDAVQLPLNPIDYHQRSFQRQVLPELTRRRIGVIAMKTSADGRLPRARLCTTEECLRFVWSLPIAVAVVGMERPQLVRVNAKTAKTPPMTEAERRALLDRLASRADLNLEWYKTS